MAAVVGDGLAILGALWFVLASLGLVRLEDTLSRMHAGTKASTLGVALVLTGSALHLGPGVAAKAVVAVSLAFLTIPLGSHLIGRAIRANVGEDPADSKG